VDQDDIVTAASAAPGREPTGAEPLPGGARDTCDPGAGPATFVDPVLSG